MSPRPIAIEHYVCHIVKYKPTYAQVCYRLFNRTYVDFDIMKFGNHEELIRYCDSGFISISFNFETLLIISEYPKSRIAC